MSIVAAAVNAHGEVVSGRHEMPIGADQSAEYVVSAITRLVRECSADIASSGLPSPTAVGVAVGGHVVDDSIVTFAPFLHWDGATDLGTMVTEATGLPCGVFNDIDSLLVDASWFGPGVGVDMFAVVTIRRGCWLFAGRERPSQCSTRIRAMVWWATCLSIRRGRAAPADISAVHNA